MKKFPTRRLGELVEILSGFAFASERFGDSGDLPIIRIRDVVSGISSTFYQGEYDPKFLIQDGDILIGMDGEFNRARWRGGAALLNQRVCRVSPSNGELDGGYLFHFLPGALKTIEAATPYVTVKHLSVTDIREIVIPLPPLAEQRRIAEVLDRAEGLRSKRRAALAQLDTLTQSIFLDLFGDPAINSKKWQLTTLDELCEKITDGEHLNPAFSHSGMPMVRAGNVLDHGIDFLNCKTVERSLGDKFRKKCDPRLGDLLIVSRGATIGRLCLVETSEEFCLMGSVILVRSSSEVIDPGFLQSLLKHPASQSRLYKTSGSSAQQAMYIKDIKNFKCIVPPLELQRRFSNYADFINRQKTVHNTSLQQLEALFRVLQDGAFRGKSFASEGELAELAAGAK